MTWIFGNKWNVALCKNIDIDGLVQDCSNSSALTLGLLQPYIESSIYTVRDMMYQLFHNYWMDILPIVRYWTYYPWEIW